MRMAKIKYETKLKMIIVERGLSYGIVSKMTGIPKSTISNYANGYRTPDYRTACRLIDILDIDIDVFATLFDPVYE